MRPPVHLPAILIVFTVLALMPGALHASPDEEARRGGDAASVGKRIEEARRRMVEAAAEVRVLRQRVEEAQRALVEVDRGSEGAEERAAERTADRARLMEASRRLRTQQAVWTQLTSEGRGEGRGGTLSPTIQRLAAALAQLSAQNRRLEARIAALEGEHAKRRAGARDRRRARSREPRRSGTQALRARLDRIEAKLDRLLRGAGAKAAGAPPTRAAVRLHPGAAAPPAKVPRPASPLPPTNVRARRLAPEAGATMMEIEQLLRRARERIRELDPSAPPGDR